MSMSEAERRREARRQRILGNQESRLQKILGPNARIPPSPAGDVFEEPDNLVDQELTPSTLLFSRKDESNKDVLESSKPTSSATPTEQESREPKNIPDTSAKVSKVTRRQHHTILFLLSVTLSVLRGSYFFLYFFLYEFSVFAINGYGAPSFYSNVNNSFLTAVAIFGMPEKNRQRFRDFLVLVSWLTTDITIFICSALFPVFVMYLLKGQ